jgi:hypothetical protein
VLPNRRYAIEAGDPNEREGVDSVVGAQPRSGGCGSRLNPTSCPAGLVTGGKGENILGSVVVECRFVEASRLGARLRRGEARR